jgi:hypothetical protein
VQLDLSKRKAWQIVREAWRQTELLATDHDVLRVWIAAVREAAGEPHEPLTAIQDARQAEADRQESERIAYVQRVKNWRHERGRELRKTMQCNCDLDRWEPTSMTGHSHVCRIHLAIMSEVMPASLTAEVLP